MLYNENISLNPLARIGSLLTLSLQSSQNRQISLKMQRKAMINVLLALKFGALLAFSSHLEIHPEDPLPTARNHHGLARGSSHSPVYVLRGLSTRHTWPMPVVV